MADDSSADIRSSRPHSRDSRDPHTPEGQIRPTGASFPGLFPPLAPTATSSSHVSANDRSHGSPSTSTSTTHTDGSSGGRSMTTTESHAGSTSPAHAALYAPYASSSSSSSSSSKPPPIPEKCLTFCTSRADAPSMCRMFCLRKKAMVASRDEELARLRPKSHRSATSSISNNDDAEPTRSAWTSFSPLASLRRTLSPYSFVYVKGTATGVVGRYMEELESDDGHRDFGPESRHAEEKRGKEREIAWYSWGEEGALLYVPLTSLFHPILSIPSTLSFFLTPPLNFLSAYRDSFTNGTQLRNAKALYEASTDGSAYTMAEKLITHHRAKVAAALERRKEVLAEREAQRADMQAQLDEQKEEMAAIERSKVKGMGQADKGQEASATGARRGGLRDRLEEAMERERSRGSDERVRDGEKERE